MAIAIIITAIGVFNAITFSGPMLENLLNNRNRGTINAANGTIIDRKIKLNTLSLAFCFVHNKCISRADDTTIASAVVTIAIIIEFLNAIYILKI